MGTLLSLPALFLQGMSHLTEYHIFTCKNMYSLNNQQIIYILFVLHIKIVLYFGIAWNIFKHLDAII